MSGANILTGPGDGYPGWPGGKNTGQPGLARRPGRCFFVVVQSQRCIARRPHPGAGPCGGEPASASAGFRLPRLVGSGSRPEAGCTTELAKGLRLLRGIYSG